MSKLAGIFALFATAYSFQLDITISSDTPIILAPFIMPIQLQLLNVILNPHEKCAFLRI
jgi:hypothetical protein